VPNAILLAGTVGLAGAYFYAIFATIHVRAFGDPVGPRMFPILLGCALVLSAAMLAYEMWSRRGSEGGATAQPGTRQGVLIVMAVAALTFAYVMAFEPAGYVVATFVYVMALTSYFHKKKHAINLAAALVFSLGTYLLFTKALQVSLPPGVLPF
jgi:putative tricarboxylic transport membrane protein